MFLNERIKASNSSTLFSSFSILSRSDTCAPLSLSLVAATGATFTSVFLIGVVVGFTGVVGALPGFLPALSAASLLTLFVTFVYLL